MIQGPPKDPASDKWYTLIWSQAEIGEGHTITQMTWGDSSPAGITKTDERLVGTGCSIKVSGGSTGTPYEIPLQIRTSDNETLNEILRFKVDPKGH